MAITARLIRVGTDSGMRALRLVVAAHAVAQCTAEVLAVIEREVLARREQFCHDRRRAMAIAARAAVASAELAGVGFDAVTNTALAHTNVELRRATRDVAATRR